MDNRNDIREFLISRRAKITPEQAGLPAYGRSNRRVSGLRREEVAILAGISVEYYTRLERGSASGVSEDVLEGIARGDFKKVGGSAEKLIQLSKTAEWFVFKTPRFELHSNEFRRAAETIVDKAKQKNLDGVTLAYFDLTMSCVRCHQYVRDVRDARGPSPHARDTVVAE